MIESFSVTWGNFLFVEAINAGMLIEQAFSRILLEVPRLGSS